MQPGSLKRLMELVKEKNNGVEQLEREIIPGKMYKDRETGRYLVVESILDQMPNQLRQIVFWYIDEPNFNHGAWNQDAYRNWEET